MPNKGARIVALQRYISLLHQEEKRLNWLISSTVASTAARADAEINARRVLEKLRNAERELGKIAESLEPDRRQ
jgi:hypothetical protein